MKRLCVVLLLALMVLPAYGAEQSEPLPELLDLDELSQAAGEYGAGLEIEGIRLEDGLALIRGEIGEHLTQVIRECTGSSVAILVVVMLCGLVRESFAAVGGDKLSVTRLVGVLGITAVAVSDAGALIGLGQTTIGEIDAFSDALLPSVALLTAASGAPAGAAAGQMAAMLFSDVLILVIDRFLLPLTYGYLAVCASAAATGNGGLKRIGGLLNWGITFVLKMILLAFVTYLTVSGVIAGSSDAMTIKTAKLTISGVIPVVGGILSDAAETVLAGAGILKNAVGVFGMVVVLGICVVPFLQLGIHYLAYRLTGALAGTVGDNDLTGFVEQIGKAFGLVLGMTGSCAFLLLISLISAMILVVR